jgi:hypothetical protein
MQQFTENKVNFNANQNFFFKALHDTYCLISMNPWINSFQMFGKN